MFRPGQGRSPNAFDDRDGDEGGPMRGPMGGPYNGPVQTRAVPQVVNRPPMGHRGVHPAVAQHVAAGGRCPTCGR